MGQRKRCLLTRRHLVADLWSQGQLRHPCYPTGSQAVPLAYQSSFWLISRPWAHKAIERCQWLTWNPWLMRPLARSQSHQQSPSHKAVCGTVLWLCAIQARCGRHVLSCHRAVALCCQGRAAFGLSRQSVPACGRHCTAMLRAAVLCIFFCLVPLPGDAASAVALCCRSGLDRASLERNVGLCQPFRAHQPARPDSALLMRCCCVRLPCSVAPPRSCRMSLCLCAAAAAVELAPPCTCLVLSPYFAPPRGCLVPALKRQFA